MSKFEIDQDIVIGGNESDESYEWGAKPDGSFVINQINFLQYYKDFCKNSTDFNEETTTITYENGVSNIPGYCYTDINGVKKHISGYTRKKVTDTTGLFKNNVLINYGESSSSSTFGWNLKGKTKTGAFWGSTATKMQLRNLGDSLSLSFYEGDELIYAITESLDNLLEPYFYIAVSQPDLETSNKENKVSFAGLTSSAFPNATSSLDSQYALLTKTTFTTPNILNTYCLIAPDKSFELANCSTLLNNSSVFSKLQQDEWSTSNAIVTVDRIYKSETEMSAFTNIKLKQWNNVVWEWVARRLWGNDNDNDPTSNTLPSIDYFNNNLFSITLGTKKKNPNRANEQTYDKFTINYPKSYSSSSTPAIGMFVNSNKFQPLLAASLNRGSIWRAYAMPIGSKYCGKYIKGEWRNPYHIKMNSFTTDDWTVYEEAGYPYDGDDQGVLNWIHLSSDYESYDKNHSEFSTEDFDGIIRFNTWTPLPSKGSYVEFTMSNYDEKDKKFRNPPSTTDNCKTYLFPNLQLLINRDSSTIFMGANEEYSGFDFGQQHMMYNAEADNFQWLGFLGTGGAQGFASEDWGSTMAFNAKHSVTWKTGLAIPRLYSVLIHKKANI